MAVSRTGDDVCAIILNAHAHAHKRAANQPHKTSHAKQPRQPTTGRNPTTKNRGSLSTESTPNHCHKRLDLGFERADESPDGPKITLML